ncbi:arginine decarboxylase, pyruvoyl-dependent [bacterium]|nr:arginine decarboxylase, pyruvoyl-dependent [bacterium]
MHNEQPVHSIPRPTKFFLTAGAAEGYTPLNAFDAALLNASVGDVNLVKLSSILPPSCTQVDRFKLEPGSLTPVAYASITSHLPGETIAAAVACAVPVDPELPGVIMEYSARGSKESAEEIVRDMARHAFEARGREVKEILSTSVEHHVTSIGSTFAAVVFGYGDV